MILATKRTKERGATVHSLCPATVRKDLLALTDERKLSAVVLRCSMRERERGKGRVYGAQMDTTATMRS